jgi:large subunit ribosomal protein L17
LAERLVTFAKRGDLAARRRVIAQLTEKSVVHELFTNIAPQVADREGGYTRITKLGFRKGDNAPMALIELVLEPVNAKPKANKTKLSNAVKAGAAAAVADVVEEEVSTEVAEDAAVEVEATEAPAEAVAEVEAEATEAPAEEAAAEETKAE